MEQTYIHIWHSCHSCGSRPIVGNRYHCTTCPEGHDNDLCEQCFLLFQQNKTIHLAQSNQFRSAHPHQFFCKQGELATSYDSWLSVPSAQPHAMPIQTGFIVRPEFICGRESYFGGHAFITKLTQRKILLTALHVLDEIIKSKRIDATITNVHYTGKELPTLLSGVNLYDVKKEQWMFHQIGTANRMLELPDARTGEEEPYCYRDIAAFEIKDAANFNPLPLADQAPVIGEPVWLIAKSQASEYAQQAVVVDKTERTLIFRYEDSNLIMRATSGAPILNSRQEVVGINIGAGFYQNRLFGHANHIDNINWHLDAVM